MHSVYANDDPYLPKTARRWRWNPTWQLVIIALVLAGTIGAVIGSVAGIVWAGR